MILFWIGRCRRLRFFTQVLTQFLVLWCQFKNGHERVNEPMQPYSSVWVYGSTVCLAITKTKWPLISPWWRNQNAFLRQSMHKKSRMRRLWKMQAAKAVGCNVLPDSATFNLPNKQTRIVCLTAKENVLVGTFGVVHSTMPEQWCVPWKTRQCSHVKRSSVTMLHWTNSVVWLLRYIKAKSM